MNLGEKIKKLRTDNRLTQDELAEKLYVTRTAVSKWENGKGYPGIDSLKLISSLFGISIDDLISDSDVNNKRLLDEKNARKMYYVAMIFLAILAAGALLCYFLQNPYLYIVNIFGLIGYHIFGRLSVPKYKRSEAKKHFISYIISRVIVYGVTVSIVIMTIVQYMI